MDICGVSFAIETFSDFLVFPTYCFYHFWLLIFGFLFLLLTYTFYDKDENKKGSGEMLSSMGVSSIAITALATWGTFVKNSQNIPMIQNDIFLWVVASMVVFVGIWIYNK
jgi:hypothetical protein